MKAATAEPPARAPATSEARAHEAPTRTAELGFAGEMLMLQRHAGNAAVGRMLAGVHGGSGERQANAVADGIAWGSAATSRAWLTIGPTTPRDVPASVVDVVGTQGHELAPGTRSAFEQRIGVALGSVRVHTDARAGASARDLGARAYTYGPHVVFGPGRFAPTSVEGGHLLAHELTHVAQQRGSRPVLQLAPDDGTAPAPSGFAAGDLVKAAILSRLVDLTLPPLGLRLAVDAGRGIGAEIITELKGEKGVALLANIKAFSLPDVNEVQQGFGVGLLSGIVSPITDLFSLAVLGERVRNFLVEMLANPMSAREGLAEDVNALLLEVGKLTGSASQTWKEITKSPRDALIFILKLPDKLSEEAEAKAYDLGKVGGSEIVNGLLQPFGLGTPEKKEEKPSWITSPAAALESAVKGGKDWLVGPSPWSKVGEKVGYALGWVAIQVVLFAFTDGIGDAIQWLAQGLGKVAKALGTFSEAIGRVATKIAEAAKAIGEGIAVVEEWFGKILAKLLKPAEKFLEPLLKQLGGVRDKLRAVLEKLFGITRKEADKVAEAAAARAAVKAEEGLERRAAVPPTRPEPGPPTRPEPGPQARPGPGPQGHPEPTPQARPEPEPHEPKPPSNESAERLPIDPDIGEGLLASRTIGGHTYKFTETGRIFRCTRCDDLLWLLDDYKSVFANNDALRRRLATVEDLAEQARGLRAAGDRATAKAVADDATQKAESLFRDVRRSAGVQRDIAEEAGKVGPKGGPPEVPPIPPAQVREGMDSLARRRAQRSLPPAGSPSDVSTVSRLDVGGESFFGVNAHDEPINLVVNAQSATHAEGGTFQRAAGSLPASRATRGVLYVDRELCRACGDFGAVESMARQLGLLHLDIYTPSGLSSFSFSIAGR